MVARGIQQLKRIGRQTTDLVSGILRNCIAHAGDTRDRRLQPYLHPNLLVLDDFGLRPLQSPGPENLYDVIDGRGERSRRCGCESDPTSDGLHGWGPPVRRRRRCGDRRS